MEREPLQDDLHLRLVNANPVDSEQLDERLATLREDVIGGIVASVDKGAAAAQRQVRPTSMWLGRRLPLAAAAVVMAIVTSAIVFGTLLGTAGQAYAITVDSRGVVVVNWMSDLRDGSAIADDLESLGVTATVTAVSASPSQVGRVLTVAVDGIEQGQAPPGLSWGADGTDGAFTWSIDPSVFSGSLDIRLGVSPEPGQPYVVAESAFAPGEVLGGLHCALGEPVMASDVGKQAERLEQGVLWVRVTGDSDNRGDLADMTPVAQRPSGTVVDVQPIDDQTIRVLVAPPGSNDLPVFEPVRPASACTPEMARRWLGAI